MEINYNMKFLEHSADCIFHFIIYFFILFIYLFLYVSKSADSDESILDNFCPNILG